MRNLYLITVDGYGDPVAVVAESLAQAVNAANGVVSGAIEKAVLVRTAQAVVVVIK